MNCNNIKLSDHAMVQMFRRDIDISEVEYVIKIGEVIEDHPLDVPYPSCLILGFVNKRPIHVVVAKNPDNNECIIVTAYEPDKTLWTSDFKFKANKI